MAEKKTDEVSLFDSEDLPEFWERMWDDMPEFVQKDLSPFKTLMVHFRKSEDFNRFVTLLGQVLTVETKSTWFPEMKPANLKVLKYVDALAEKPEHVCKPSCHNPCLLDD